MKVPIDMNLTSQSWFFILFNWIPLMTIARAIAKMAILAIMATIVPLVTLAWP